MRLVVRHTDLDEIRALDERDHLADLGTADRIALVCDAIATDGEPASAGDRAVGFVVVARRHLFGRDFVELLLVDEDHRRLGVGRTLLRAALDQPGTTRVFSSTNESNHAMRALFSTDGWTLSGRLDGLDADDPEYVVFIDRSSPSTDRRDQR